MSINNISDGYQGILTLLFGGAGNEVEVNLIPDASNNIHISSDQSVVFSDLCHYLSTQPCARTYGLININNNAGNLFTRSDSAILQNNQFVILKCSDGHVLFNQVDGAFTLDVYTIPSDQVNVAYTNTSPAFSSTTTWPFSAHFHIDFAQQDWAVIDPSFSGFPTITDTNVIDKPLLSVDLDHAPIKKVGKIGCVRLCEASSSDADYICQLLSCCSDMENYLLTHYFTNISDLIAHISDKCSIVYNGPVCAQHGFLDLSTCRMRIQGAIFRCSDRKYYL